MKHFLGAISDELISTLRLMARQLTVQSVDTHLSASPIWLSFESACETGGGLMPAWEPPTFASGLAFQVVVGSGILSAEEDLQIVKADMAFGPKVQHTPVDRALKPEIQIIPRSVLAIPPPGRHQQRVSVAMPRVSRLALFSSKSLWKTIAHPVFLPIGKRLRAGNLHLERVCQWPVLLRPTPLTRFTPAARQIFRDALSKMTLDSTTPSVIQAVFGPLVLSAFQGLAQTPKGLLEATPVKPEAQSKSRFSDKAPVVYLILGQQKSASKLLQAVVPVEAIHR